MRRHRLARMSTILHASLEAPLQFLVLCFSYSKGLLPLPWSQSTNYVDRHGNIIPLGKVSLMALVMTCISLLKGSNETVETTSLIKRAWANIYIAISLYFSILYNIIYFEYISVVFIFLLFVTNYLVLLYHNETNRKWASTIASLFVSIFLPVCIARDPERYQIKERNENSNETADQRIMTENEENSKELAFWLSIFANPISLLADASVFLCVKYTDYKHATIWSDVQLEQSFTLFLLPLFCISMLASFAYSPYLEKESDPHRNFGIQQKNFWQSFL